MRLMNTSGTSMTANWGFNVPFRYCSIMPRVRSAVSIIPSIAFLFLQAAENFRL
jgi:hypothetical protein